MLALPLECDVAADHTLTLRLPDSIAPGRHKFIIVVDQPVPPARNRQPGSAKGKLVIHAEDDDHLQDFGDYMP